MSCSVKQVSRLWLQGLPTPAGPVLCARHPGKGVITIYWKFPSAHSVSSPRPVLVSCVLARTPSGPPFLGEITRELQAALHSSFYELCTFHFKDEESEIQNNKLFGKRSVLPWAWVMQATCSCHRLGSRAQLELGSTPAT